MRSPSCERLHRQTAKPSQLHMAPTRRSGRSKDKRTKQLSVVNIATWDDSEGMFTVHKMLAKGWSKKTKTSKSKKRFPKVAQFSEHEVRSSRPSARNFLTSPHAMM